MDEATLILTDETGKALPCYVEKAFAIEGVDYLLLLPVDYAVQIFAWEKDEDENEEEGTLVEIEEEEVDLVFPIAQAVLAEKNLTLKRSAFTLTVEGEMPEVTEDDIVTIDSEEEEDIHEEFVEIAHFYHEEQAYSVFAELDPLPYFAKRGLAGKPELLSPDELSGIQPYLEEHLVDSDDEEED